MDEETMAQAVMEWIDRNDEAIESIAKQFWSRIASNNPELSKSSIPEHIFEEMTRLFFPTVYLVISINKVINLIRESNLSDEHKELLLKILDRLVLIPIVGYLKGSGKDESI